eukprot:ANDGO_03073.mRNA.1 Prefoldin subunit 3
MSTEISSAISALYLEGFPADYKNGRGIPRAEFIEDVEAFVRKAGSFEAAFRSVEDLFSKYRMMESQKLQSKAQYKKKLPDVEKTVEMIRFLKEKHGKNEAVRTQFNVSAQIHTEAELHKADTVVVWLGANTAVEFSHDEALEMLQKNSHRMEEALKEVDEDLAFLKDCITTMEVSMARLYNYDIQMKREKKE